MKKFIISIAIILISIASYGQAKINRAGPANTVVDQNLNAANTFIMPYFNDTTLATVGLDSCGKIFYNRGTASVWYRACIGYSSRKWIEISVNSSPTISAWLTRGNDLSTQSLPNRLGTKNGDGLNIITNDLIRMIVPVGGIVRSSSAQNRFLMQDTVGKEIYYGDFGGNLTPTWQQTLDAGSVLNKANDITGAFSLTFTDQTSFNIVKSGVGRLAITNATTQIYAPGGSTGIILSNTSASIGATNNTNIDAPIINIGSTSSGAVINLGGEATVPELRFLEGSGGGTNYVGFKANATLAGNTIYTLPTAFPAGTYLLNSTSAGVMGFTDPSTFLTALANGSGTTASGNSVNLGGTATEDIVIDDNDGSHNFDIGRTTAFSSIRMGATGGYEFNGAAVQMSFYGAGAATFDGSGNITSVSSRKVKHGIVPFKYGLNSILALNPSSFIYNQDKSNTLMSGFIAEDVKKVIPIAVHSTKGGLLSLETNAILAAQINATKELYSMIVKQQKEIDQLKQKFKNK